MLWRTNFFLMLSLTILLFIILDPFGNMFAVNSMLKSHSLRERRKIIAIECAIATVILIGAALLGQTVLDLLKLKQYSLSVAGGVVLFIIALGMIFPLLSPLGESEEERPFIVPIAIPLIAGPGTISLIMLLTREHATSLVIAAILCASLLASVILVFSSIIFKRLGKSGSKALERLMGMLLVIISIQMIIDGIHQCF